MKIQYKIDAINKKSEISIESKEDIISYKLTGTGIINHTLKIQYVTKNEPRVEKTVIVNESKTDESVSEVPAEMMAQW